MSVLDRDDLTVFWETSEDMSSLQESPQSVITSPPYWDLKDYGHDDQIGVSDESYERYLDRLDAVWSECYDVLEESGTMWVVVDTVMDRGDLRLLPYHIAQRAEAIGFTLQDMVVWHKPTAIAGMTARNTVNKKEYVVYLSKSEDHKFNELGSDENGVEDPAIEEGKPLGDLWRFPVKRGSVGKQVLHKASYPVSLSNRMVQLSTDRGEIVLDPFLGSGTTAYSALDLGRQCVGYEINRDFESVIEDRLSDLSQSTLDNTWQ